MTTPGVPRVTRAAWQCPGCRTYYSPDVQECRCEVRPRPLSERVKPQGPIRLGGGTMRFPQWPQEDGGDSELRPA